MIDIDVLSIFPEFFHGPLHASLLGRAQQDGVLSVAVHDLRTYTHDAHRSVDGPPFGGGAGMIMSAPPFFEAVEGLYGSLDDRPRTVVTTPRGQPLRQPLVHELAAERRLLILCGRYEGIDERVHTTLATDEISIGDYVLAGGEVAACVLIETMARLIPGVMGNSASAVEESFEGAGLLEHPHYTRPASYRDMDVPPVLLSGDHGKIARWRAAQREERTARVRPDLLGNSP